MEFHLVPSSTADRRAHEATLGNIASNKEVIFGYRLHLLVSLGGLILDTSSWSRLTSAISKLVFELLIEHTDLEVLGDKAYIGVGKTAYLREYNRIDLPISPRRNQTEQLPAAYCHLHNAMRQIIETVNDQLTEQLHIEVNQAHSFWGLCTRLYGQLTAHTLCVYLNRLLGQPDFLHIKGLAFAA